MTPVRFYCAGHNVSSGQAVWQGSLNVNQAWLEPQRPPTSPCIARTLLTRRRDTSLSRHQMLTTGHTASLGYARRGADNIGCNGGLDRLRHRVEFSYVVSRSEDIDLK
jgi:hypothetical protein